MINSIFETDDTMPVVIKKAYTEVLPRFIAVTDDSLLSHIVVELASAFGDAGEFSSIVGEKKAERNDSEKKLVTSFQKNIELLVQKTWVEKADETMKDEVLFRINALCENLLR